MPAADLADCLEVHLARHRPVARPFYLCTIALIGLALGALPFVRVPVIALADGMLRPAVERHDARAADGGTVTAIRIWDGVAVTAGDTLVVLGREDLVARLVYADSIRDLRRAELRDLDMLLDAPDDNIATVALTSAARRQQRREYVIGLRERTTRHRDAEQALQRVRQLYDKGFATLQQLEEHEIAARVVGDAIHEHRERMRTQWSQLRESAAEALHRLAAERADILESMSRRVVLAPIDGTVEIVANFSPGSVIQSGERLATISPDTPVVAEVLLSARDVGLVHLGTPVRLMVDGFNYRDWGVAHGRVSEIANDATIATEHAAFRVRSRLDEQHLITQAGVRAQLRKGMTVRARFLIAERTLWQLLFDRADGWASPLRDRLTISQAR